MLLTLTVQRKRKKKKSRRSISQGGGGTKGLNVGQTGWAELSKHSKTEDGPAPSRKPGLETGARGSDCQNLERSWLWMATEFQPGVPLSPLWTVSSFFKKLGITHFLYPKTHNFSSFNSFHNYIIPENRANTTPYNIILKGPPRQ